MSNKIQTFEHILLVIYATQGYMHTRLILTSSKILHCKISSKIQLRPIVSNIFLLISCNYLNEPLFHPSPQGILERTTKEHEFYLQIHILLAQLKLQIVKKTIYN
jgi:hypothetical protein